MEDLPNGVKTAFGKYRAKCRSERKNNLERTKTSISIDAEILKEVQIACIRRGVSQSDAFEVGMLNWLRDAGMVRIPYELLDIQQLANAIGAIIEPRLRALPDSSLPRDWVELIAELLATDDEVVIEEAHRSVLVCLKNAREYKKEDEDSARARPRARKTRKLWIVEPWS